MKIGDIWNKPFEIYLKASGLEQQNNQVKVTILLNMLDENSLEAFNTFALAEEQKIIIIIIGVYLNHSITIQNHKKMKWSKGTNLHRETHVQILDIITHVVKKM